MTTPSAADAETVRLVKPAPLWEDFIEIFTSPSTVYERRRDANPWPMILIITVLVTLITVFTFNSLAPVFESELRTAMTAAMAKNPQMTQDMVDKGIGMQMGIRRWSGVFYFIGVLIIALPVWLLGRICGAKELTYTRSMVVVAWAGIFAVLTFLVLGVQGLVMDVSAITSADKLSISPARFMDKATTAPFLYGVAKALELFGIWSAIVMGIGVRVVGRGTKNTTIAFAATWIIVTALIMGVVAMRGAM